MNAHKDFEKNLNLISQFNGCTLNIEERIRLEIALNELHAETKVEELYFWGKIFGEETDYYIALGINFKGHYEFPEKKFFFASRSFKFEPLPETYDYHDKDFIDNYYKPLKGTPDLIIKKYREENPEEEEGGQEADQQQEEEEHKEESEEDDENEKKKEEPKENFTEKLKLSYLVRKIDFDTNIIPVGAFKLNPEHELIINRSFKGLKEEELKNKKSYLHFRPVQSEEMKEFLETDDAIFSFGVLDSIDEDIVKCSWSIQLDPTKTISNVRSLLWPGYFAIHKSNSNVYCGCYFGNGLKNNDLAFMV